MVETKKKLKTNRMNIMKRRNPDKVKTNSVNNYYSSSLLIFKQWYHHSGVVVLVHHGLVLQVNTECLVDVMDYSARH